MSGKYLHRPTEPHACELPVKDQNRHGAIWQCDCGQHWMYYVGAITERWITTSASSVEKVLAKIKESS